MTWIHERFKVLKCKVQAGENAGTLGVCKWRSSRFWKMFAEGHQISAEIRKELNPPLLRVSLKTYNEHIPYNVILDQCCWFCSFSTGGSHSLMMVLSEHLDLFTPLAGSRLIGRVDWESRLPFGFSLRWVFFCGDFLSFGNARFQVETLSEFDNRGRCIHMDVYMYMYVYICIYHIYIYMYIHSIIYTTHKACH